MMPFRSPPGCIKLSAAPSQAESDLSAVGPRRYPRPVSDASGSLRDTFKTWATNAKTPLVRGGARVAGGSGLQKAAEAPRNEPSVSHVPRSAIADLPSARAPPRRRRGSRRGRRGRRHQTCDVGFLDAARLQRDESRLRSRERDARADTALDDRHEGRRGPRLRGLRHERQCELGSPAREPSEQTNPRWGVHSDGGSVDVRKRVHATSRVREGPRRERTALAPNANHSV